jgi:hypothetical protein
MKTKVTSAIYESSDLIANLERLAELHDRAILNDDEFAEAKKRLLE